MKRFLNVKKKLQGNIVWQKPYGDCWDQSYPETRCTPTVEDDRVYVLTGKDQMACFHAISGEEIWSVDIHKEYDSRWDMFGVSESVLLVGDYVITTPAGESTMAIALDKMTGDLVWKSKPIGAKRSNMSPILIDHCGKEYVIASSQTHMIGLDPQDGKILWDYHYNFLSEAHENTTILANTPIYKDSCLWISNGWDVPSVMLEISPDGMLYCQEEKRGHMALVKADPEAFEVISTFRVTEGAGPHWARPTIFNQMLLVRHGDVLLASKLKP